MNELPFASLVQPFADPTEGHLRDVASIGVNITGLLVFGNRLYGAASIYYDASNSQSVSHFSRSLRLDEKSFSGWSRVWDAGRVGYVSGMMALVPSEWQARLGGPAVTGQCCIPIVTRTSVGPAAFAFDPVKIGQPTVSATPLVYYTWTRPPSDRGRARIRPMERPRDSGGNDHRRYAHRCCTSEATVLAPHCYGDGTANKSLDGTKSTDGAHVCYDPTNNSKGSHAYPYRSQIWAYDLNELAAVKDGRKKPWQVVPYGVWPLTLPTTEPSMRLGGVGYDAERQIIYVSQLGADPDGYASRPVMHAFQVALPKPVK